MQIFFSALQYKTASNSLYRDSRINEIHLGQDKLGVLPAGWRKPSRKSEATQRSSENFVPHLFEKGYIAIRT